MATINECEKAIWMYNDFPTGEFKLRVKFSKTEEERNRQAREKQVISLLKIFLTKIILQSKIKRMLQLFIKLRVLMIQQRKVVGIQIIFTFLHAIQDTCNDVRNHDGATSMKYLLEG